MEFSHELALALVQSEDEFPVDFDYGWRWIGYSTKQKAKDKLTNNFESGIDYHINQTVKLVKRSQGGGSGAEDIRLTIDCFKSLGMMAGTEKGKEIRRYFLHCERIAQKAAEAIPAKSQEFERMKLELELIRAKQHYQDTGYAIQLSISAAMLRWLRGETPPPKEIEYRDRFLDSATKREINSAIGRSLTQLIADAGLNPKSTKDRNRIKKILKSLGFDYDKMQRWSTTSYLREYPVLEDQAYEQVLKAVLDEVVGGDSQPNLFVHSMQQAALTPKATTGKLNGGAIR